LAGKLEIRVESQIQAQAKTAMAPSNPNSVESESR
jgi:hypothetical protein